MHFVRAKDSWIKTQNENKQTTANIGYNSNYDGGGDDDDKKRNDVNA